jgi:hypothetical protein
VVVTTEVEAETAEDALRIEEMTATDLVIQSALPTTYWWSDNSAWVDDENGETVLED